MKEVLVYKGPEVKIVDSPIPEPGPDDVITKVVAGGCNQKDWKMAEWGMEGMNQGDDFGGLVHSVGANITEFHPGDRVAGFHAMMKPGGAYAEYTISPAHMTFHIPKKTTFEEAATIPLTAMTAAVLLDHVLGLPQRGSDLTKPTPLVIYGAASAVGAYAVQLANKAGIHPLICVAGKGIPFVESLIDKSKGDVVIDYRKDGLVDGIKSAVPSGEKLMYAFDAISGHGSYQNICKVLSTDGGKLALVLPPGDDIPKGIQATQGQVGIAFNDQKELGFAWSRLFGLGLQDGWLHPHPHEVVPGGLGGIQQALANLKSGKASALKYVFRPAETKGID